MIYLKLFLTFFKIGVLSFGGGYGMISLIREETLINGWLTEDEILNLIAVSESTPGPIAVNIATFVGSTQAGILGSLLATLGVILPSFIIILIIAALIQNLLKYAGVGTALDAIRPCITGLILATAITMFLSSLLSIETLSDSVSVDWGGIIIFAVLVISSFSWEHFKKKKPSPILMILLSAGLGMLLYSFF